jgi:hypothetical protein
LTTAGNLSTGVLFRFRLNGMYDPDVTGSGHQPYFFDQVKAVYLNYLVRTAHVNLTWSDPTADGVWVGWSIHPGSTSNDDPSTLQLQDFLERPNFKVAPLNNTGAQTVTLRQSVPIHTVLGLSKIQYEGDVGTNGAAYNADPSSIVYLDIFLVDPTANATARSVRISGVITYDCKFFNYAAPGAS